MKKRDKKSQQFDHLGKRYAFFVAKDPVRNFLHYPQIRTLIAFSPQTRVLDIGCGDGTFLRLLTKEKVRSLFGFDLSPQLIALAKKQNRQHKKSSFTVSTPQKFTTTDLFDYATSVMVLPYATNTKDLQSFFRCAFASLQPGGSFISIVFNPLFHAFDTVVANRKFTKMTKLKIRVSFLDVKHLREIFTSQLTQFSQKHYEGAAEKAGFKKMHWQKLSPTDRGLRIYGGSFWKRCIKEQPYAIFLCTKTTR